MSITVPSTLTPPELGDFYSGQQIEDGDWDTLLQSLHYVWSRRGARVTGKLFNPPFETTSTTYTQANESGEVEDLTVWQGSSRVLRDGASNLQLGFAAYGANITVRVTATALDTNTSLGTIELTLGGTAEWDNDSLVISFANADEGGSTANPRRHIGYKVEAKVSSGTGELYQFAVYEAILGAAAIP